jgi:hypothetical protein
MRVAWIEGEKEMREGKKERVRRRLRAAIRRCPVY